MVIDDDKDIGELVVAAAQEMGFVCVATTNAAQFPELFTFDTNLILLDLMMPEMDGIEVLRLLSEQQCKAGIVLMSGISTRILETAEKLARALGLSVVGHLQKPFRLTELEEVLSKYLDMGAPKNVVNYSPQADFQDEELRNAIECDELVLHYQPLTDIETGNVAGLEALVRWQHPTLGLIFPDNFIPRVEALGLIDELGWLTIDRGLAEVGKFVDKDGVIPGISLNITVHSLLDLKFPDTFISLTKKHGVSAANVTIEITETGLIKELSYALDVLTRLRMKSVQLSIDDFGSGYAMMKQLRNVPATELKIDMNFVQNMHINTGDRVMVQKTIEIGHELGLQVVAEGVETQQQLDFLRLEGCDIAQGYLFSRPLPQDGMVSWLEEYRSRQVQ